MPIKIRELHIKATVSGEQKEQESTQKNTGQEIDKQEIIASCVSQVLRILNKKEDR